MTPKDTRYAGDTATVSFTHLDERVLFSYSQFSTIRLMAVHTILTHPKILRAIFEHLVGGQQEQNELISARRQLARVGRCCRTFSEPALDVLWKEMDDLTPLFKILPMFQKVNDVYVSSLLRALVTGCAVLIPLPLARHSIRRSMAMTGLASTCMQTV